MVLRKSSNAFNKTFLICLPGNLMKEKEFHRFKIARYVCSYPSRQKLLTPHKLVCSISQATYHCSQGLPGALQIVY